MREHNQGITNPPLFRPGNRGDVDRTRTPRYNRRIATVILVIVTLIGFASPAVTPAQAATAAGAVKITEFSIRIPVLKVDRPVVKAPYTSDSWNFARLRYNAGYLEGRPLPGSNNNVAIGAHVTLAKLTPGPFYKLNTLKPGDEIFVRFNGTEFRYEVESMWETVPTDGSPISQADKEMLTLFTCSGYNPKGGLYETRLIVRAKYAPAADAK
jgi:LPXTG-site transpeptidase (sortase) family protein